MVSATKRSRRVLAGMVLSLALVGAGGGVADAAMPVPVRGASCEVGGDTQAVWRHLSVATVELYWFDIVDNTYHLVSSTTVSPLHGRRGTVTRPTPAGFPTGLTVQFLDKDGGSLGAATASCYA